MIGKNGERCIINSEIPLPDIKQLPIITLNNEPYQRKKTRLFIMVLP